MGELFLGRYQELTTFSEEFARFLSEARAEKPQVFLVSGRGGIGKSALVRRMRELAEDLARSCYYELDLDWHLIRSEHFADQNSLTNQGDPRAIYVAINQQIRFPAWNPAKNALSKVLREIDSALSHAEKLASSPKRLPLSSDGVLGDLVQAAGTIASKTVDPSGTTQAVLGPLARLGSRIPGAISELLLSGMRNSYSELLRKPESRLAIGLGQALETASRQRPLLIAFDSYEIVDEADLFLRLVIQHAGPKVLWILSGRRDLWEFGAPSPNGQIKGFAEDKRFETYRFDLEGFARQHVQTFLKVTAPQRLQPTEIELDRVIRATMAIPLAVKMASQIWKSSGRIEDIESDTGTAADGIVNKMVACYRLQCLLRPLDGKILDALVLAENDSSLLYAMIRPEASNDEDYQASIHQFRRRHSALFLDGIEPRLHDEPARFLAFAIRGSDDERRRVRPLNILAIDALRRRLSELVEQADSLEELCDEPAYLDGSARMLDHLIWAGSVGSSGPGPRAWTWLLKRYVEGMAYSNAFRNRLLGVAQKWQAYLPASAIQKKISRLVNLEREPLDLAARCDRLELVSTLSERVDENLIPERFEEERAGILIIESAYIGIVRGELSAALRDLESHFISDSGVRPPGRLASQVAQAIDFAFHKRGDSRRGLRATALAMNLDPKNYQARREHGTNYQTIKKYEKAFSYHFEVYKLIPKDFANLREMGTDCALAGKYLEAEGWLLKALHENAEDSATWRTLGTVRRNLGQLDSSKECLLRAVNFSPHDAISHMELGTTYADQDDLPSALRHHSLARDLNPEDAATWRELGNDYRALKNFAQAKSLHEHALSLDYHDSQSWRELGTDFSLMKDYRAAADCHQAAVEDDPADPIARAHLGMDYLFNKEYTQAIGHLTKALDLDQKNLAALVNLAYCRMVLGETKEAEADFRLAIDSKFSVPNAFCLWSLMLYRQRNYRGALQKIQSALTTRPGYFRYILFDHAIRRLVPDLKTEPDERSINIVHRELEASPGQHLLEEAEWLALSGRPNKKVFAKLEEATATIPNNAVYARFRPAFEGLRSDPRFIELTEDAPGSSWDDYPHNSQTRMNFRSEERRFRNHRQFVLLCLERR